MLLAQWCCAWRFGFPSCDKAVCASWGSRLCVQCPIMFSNSVIYRLLFFLFLPFKFVLKWSRASGCVGCFLLKISSLPEKGLTRSSETWLLSETLINKYQSGALILLLVAFCIPFFPQCGTEQTPWGLERRQSALPTWVSRAEWAYLNVERNGVLKFEI